MQSKQKKIDKLNKQTSNKMNNKKCKIGCSIEKINKKLNKK